MFYRRNDAWKGPVTVIGQDGPLVFIRHGGSIIRAHQTRSKKETFNSDSEDQKLEKSSSPSLPQETDSDEDDIPKNQQPQTIETESTKTVSKCPEVSPPGTTNHGTVMKLRKGDKISFSLNDETVSGTVTGRGGKAGGKYSNWYNFEANNQRFAVDLDNVSNLQVSKSEDIVYLTKNPFDEAKKSELDNWKRLEVYTEIQDYGQDFITCRWVLTEKELGFKARLVARGFEDYSLPPEERQSPTCSREAIRIVFVINASMGWKLRSLDIKAAFLQGAPSDRIVYLKPPVEANTDKLWKLKKIVYGLADASLKWYEKVKDTLMSFGCDVSALDKGLFLKFENNISSGMLAVHVDVFIWAGDTKFVESVIEKIYSTLEVGRDSSESFKYLGLDVCQFTNLISVSQEA